MATYVFPTSAELTLIAQTKMARLTADRPCFDFFPITTQDASKLVWEQLDNFKGLQNVRGMNGAPKRVKAVGLNRFEMHPGVYGEFASVDEADLTQRRQYGTALTPINIEDLVLEKQDQLLLRRLDRIEYIIWTLLTTGTFSVPSPDGAILHTDTFTLETFVPAVPWSIAATATPMADFSTIQLKRRGKSVSFGADATCYMNRKTWNAVRLNTNAADIYGKRTAGFGTINSLPGINALFQGDDLPAIAIYDETYLDESGAAVPFIPDGSAVVIGKRPAGQVVGQYRMTRNAENPDLAPGPYMKVIDNVDREVPREIQVHDGHNGGPVLFYGSAIVKMIGLLG